MPATVKSGAVVGLRTEIRPPVKLTDITLPVPVPLRTILADALVPFDP